MFAGMTIIPIHLCLTGLPNFVSKLQDAAGKVSDLVGPEPALLRCLRSQIEAHCGSVTTTITEDFLEVQLSPKGLAHSSEKDSITVHDENCLVSVVEDASSPIKAEAGDEINVSQSSLVSDIHIGGPNQNENGTVSSQDVSDPTVKITSTPSSCATTSASTSNENAQFLSRNPVYA